MKFGRLTLRSVTHCPGDFGSLKWAIVVLGFIGAVIFSSWSSFDPAVDTGVMTKEILVRYSFTVQNTSNETIGNAEFSTFSPLEHGPFQEVVSLESSHPFSSSTDRLGNRTISFNIKELPPFGSKVVTVTAHLKVWDTSVADYNMSDRESLYQLIPESDPVLLDAVNSFSASGLEPYKWAEALSEWVNRSMTDAGYISKDLGAEYALRELRGDCTEYMYLFLSIARSRGLPALGVAGFRIHGASSILDASDYHNWAYFKPEMSARSWHLADPHGGNFDQHAGNYIAFAIIDTSDTNVQNSQRFFSYDSRVRVEMN